MLHAAAYSAAHDTRHKIQCGEQLLRGETRQVPRNNPTCLLIALPSRVRTCDSRRFRLMNSPLPLRSSACRSSPRCQVPVPQESPRDEYKSHAERREGDENVAADGAAAGDLRTSAARDESRRVTDGKGDARLTDVAPAAAGPAEAAHGSAPLATSSAGSTSMTGLGIRSSLRQQASQLASRFREAGNDNGTAAVEAGATDPAREVGALPNVGVGSPSSADADGAPRLQEVAAASESDAGRLQLPGAGASRERKTAGNKSRTSRAEAAADVAKLESKATRGDVKLAAPLRSKKPAARPPQHQQRLRRTEDSKQGGGLTGKTGKQAAVDKRAMADDILASGNFTDLVAAMKNTTAGNFDSRGAAASATGVAKAGAGEVLTRRDVINAAYVLFGVFLGVVCGRGAGSGDSDQVGFLQNVIKRDAEVLEELAELQRSMAPTAGKPDASLEGDEPGTDSEKGGGGMQEAAAMKEGEGADAAADGDDDKEPEVSPELAVRQCAKHRRKGGSNLRSVLRVGEGVVGGKQEGEERAIIHGGFYLGTVDLLSSCSGADDP